MTPLMITMLINYQCNGDGHFLNGSPAQADAFEYFKENGFISRNGDSRYTGTDKTAAYLHALCEIPDPVHKWIIPLECID